MLTNIEKLLTLCGILPMLKEMHNVMKIAQTRHIYIVDFVRVRKHTYLIL